MALVHITDSYAPNSEKKNTVHENSVKSFPVVPTSVTHGKFRRVIKINFPTLVPAECPRVEVLQLKERGCDNVLPGKDLFSASVKMECFSLQCWTPSIHLI
jgi:hypothetical protein